MAQFNFFSTAFDPRAWMVVFWKENMERQPPLITPENEGGDETNYPSPPKFFDDPDVPFGPCGLDRQPQVPQIHPMVTPEPDGVSDEEFTAMNPSPPSAEQRGRSRRDERSRSRERVPPHSSSHASQQLQPVGADEDSATVDPQNRVSDRSRSPQEREGSRRQGP